MSGSELPTAEIERLITLVGASQPCPDAAGGLARIEALERLRNATAAAIARQAVTFAAARTAEQADAGERAAEVHKGVVGELALARRASPHAAARHLGWARIMLTELPETFAVLQAGVTSEWRATLVARETGWLDAEHRTEVDRVIATELPGLGDRETERRARALAIARDPAGRVRRLALAESQRHVSLRPAPDLMSWFTALLPMKQGVAVLAALRRAADTTAGDGRSRGQVMADTLVERLTGQATADGVPLAVNLTLPAGGFLAAGAHKDQPGELDGYGPVPADVARDLIRRTATANDRDGHPVPLWIRRLYTAPDTGALVTMETRARFFTDNQRAFIKLRDRICRTPYCGAPIRETDHVTANTHGGPTSLTNAQGLCQRCNQTKQAPGWRTRAKPDGTIEITTPSGHHYQSRPRGLSPPLRTPGPVRTAEQAARSSSPAPPGSRDRPVP